ncbi:hypothetical protein WJT74_03570 [Sphingomicrobium sp. XHP0239]
MDIVTILIALVLAFLVWKFVTGIIKFVLIAVVVVAAFFIATGGAAF